LVTTAGIRKSEIEGKANVEVDGSKHQQDLSKNYQLPKLIIPSDGWIPVQPVMISKIGQRNPLLYQQVIDQFQVETQNRYKIKGHDTYCNIFMWDVTSAMGAEIPHWVDEKTGVPRRFPDIKGARELNANDTVDWLRTYGKDYGWIKVSAEEAQMAANKGEPAITAFKNPGGRGHFQIIRPSEYGYDKERGVFIAQAGAKNFNSGYITQVYQKNRLNEIEYYIHK